MRDTTINLEYTIHSRVNRALGLTQCYVKERVPGFPSRVVAICNSETDAQRVKAALEGAGRVAELERELEEARRVIATCDYLTNAIAEFGLDHQAWGERLETASNALVDYHTQYSH